MRTLKLLTIIFCIVFIQEIHAQGCVAIRGNSSCSAMQGSSFNLMKGEFLSQAGLRHFKSFRHFRGTTEETNRLEDGTEVINRSYLLDLSLSYGITDRLYANMILPFVFHNRSSMYEHGGNPPNGLGERHETTSKGLSDMRLGLGYWLFKPSSRQFNYSIGLGVKFPTGKYDYTDTFYNQGENRDENIESVVDQSIQPGDGGTGPTLEMQGYHSFSHAFMITANIFYLFNYQDTNGVLTRNGRSEFSCPDQFGLRVGVNYSTMYGFNAYLGARMEGVPSDDLIGNSSGYRRPGYVVSVEPGIGYFKNNYSLNFNVPIAVKRNRTQSYEDKERTIQTGVYQHGDAAFADYLLNVSFSYRFGGHHELPENSNLN